jgi:precorrin-4/cobalt-precorrin-4 C11-methyltransferase
MPAGEHLAALAKPRATLAIHHGVRPLARIVDELRPHYGGDCPIAVVYRASWPDEEKIVGTLDDIVGKVQTTSIERTALILVGRVLAADGFAESTLYAKGA